MGNRLRCDPMEDDGGGGGSLPNHVIDSHVGDRNCDRPVKRSAALESLDQLFGLSFVDAFQNEL